MDVLWRRSTTALGTASLAVVLVLAGAVLGSPGGADDSRSAATTTTAAAAAPGTVEALQAHLSRLPGDHPAWAALGLRYVDLARTTADPSWYGKAEAAFERSLEVRPDDNAAALTGLASLHAARHDFAAAVQTARAAVEVNSHDATAYGVLTDALTELGRYDEAAEALQRMADLDPGFAALARISYARELRGDVAGAEQAMQQALAAAGTDADAGFALHHLGELAWHYGGDVTTAADFYARGLARDPSSLALQAAVARAAAAAGDPERALALYAEVNGTVPVQEHLVDEAELLLSRGRTDEAEERLDVVRSAQLLLERSGAAVDLETALFEADHGTPERALAAARAAYGRAPSVFAADALAWALHGNGLHEQALAKADEALALGARPASFLYHRGVIAHATGRDAEAARDLREALAVDPHFSFLHAPAARELLAVLER